MAGKIIEITGSKSKLVYASERLGDVKHSLADISKIREKLGFETRVTLEEGLERTVEYLTTLK